MRKHISVIKDSKYKKFDNGHQIVKFKRFNSIKLYLAEITFKDSGEVFHKFGLTSKTDASSRFFPSEYQPNFSMFKQPVRILASAFMPVRSALKWEKYFQDKYPKNIHIKEYFNGISEVVLLNRFERYEAIKKIMTISKYYKTKRLKSIVY
jgi:hypothetical protein